MPEERFRHLTILHSNDLHGDFLPVKRDGVMTGGVSLLSGYVNRATAENPDTLYVIAGDLFRGSVIDAEYKGISTVEIINMLSPDAVCVGNHETDYGVAHLLFIEKCARFPLINANLHVTTNGARLFRPCHVTRIGGMKVLFIGILTEEVLAQTRSEKLIGSFIDIRAAAEEVRHIAGAYRGADIDLTVLLTHVGLSEDRKLAAMLDPAWGVDLIIGGHSHTFMEAPEVVNGITIVQAGTGTGIVGRLDLIYDSMRKNIQKLDWSCVPINEKTAPKDPVMEELLESYRTETDSKYKRVITRWARRLTHPSREQETEMGNLYADAIQWESSFDIMMMGSGSIRKKELGPLIEYQDMVENTPFDDCIWMVTVTGAQFRQMIRHIMRDDAWKGETEFYQFSKGVHIRYNKTTRVLEELQFKGKDVTDDMRLKIALQNYHYTNFEEFLGVQLADVKANARPRVVAVSLNNIVEEYFATHDRLDAHVEGRIELVE